MHKHEMKTVYIGVYNHKASYCLRYARGNSCSKRCGDFHICKFYLSGCCRKGDGCRLSHSFSDIHNRRIKRELGFDHYSDENMAVLIRNCYPQVCPATPKLCHKGGDCPYLHICDFFLRGTCRISDCFRSHDLHDEHNAWVLDAFDRRRVDLDDDDLIESIPYLCPKKKRTAR